MRRKIRKAMITGGAGFIGSHIADALIKENVEVVVFDNLSSGNLKNLEHVKEKIEFVKGDIRDLDALARALEGCDTVFHQAAVVSVTKTVENPVDSSEVNDMGTLKVLEASRQNNVKRVVLASSSAVYGDDPRLPKVEDMVPKPLSPYAVQKLTGELYAAMYMDLYGLETVFLRYFNVFGPRQDPSSPYSGVISIFMTKANNKEQPTIFGDGNQTRDFVYVKDVVNANLLAASEADAVGQAFNVGTGRYITIKALWDLVCKLAGIGVSASYADPRPGDILESFSDIGKAENLMGFKPLFTFEKGLKETFKWYDVSR